MKTDDTGGSPAEAQMGKSGAGGQVEDRLARRFAVELDRAERDYPALRHKLAGTAPAAPVGRGAWPKIALPATAAAVLAVAVLIVSGLLSGSVTGPATPAPQASGAVPSGVVMAPDGIPSQIDGQHVYRLDAQVDWQKLGGSFLLGAYAVDAPIPCAPPLPSTHPQSSAEADLVPKCGVVELGPLAKDNSEYFFNLAPRGLAVLTGWLNGPAVVMRVHTHDPEAAGCAGDSRTACDSAVVVEAVVWPTVPAQIDGERVYRATDQASFASLTGSFLLGGVVIMPDVIPPCPAPIDKSDAEQQLLPYCFWRSIDGLTVAPKSALDAARNEIVVARVHVDDPLAARCPADVRADCEAAIVVEAVVWRSSPWPTATATPAASTSTAINPASSATAGPAGQS